MKIAIIGPTYPFRGGISYFTTFLYGAVRKRADSRLFSFSSQYPKFLFPGKSDKDPSATAFREDGVTYSISPLNPLSWIDTFLKIKAYGPDLTVIQWWVAFWAPSFFTIAALLRLFTRTKVLFICHNVLGHEKLPMENLLTRAVLSLGDHLLALSGEDEARLKKMFPGKSSGSRPHPTYDAFDMGRFNRDSARKELGVSGNVALFFGFVREYKGLRHLLRAMPLILRETDLTLLVVGEFWKDKGSYTDLIDSLGIAPKVMVVDRFVNNEEAEIFFKASDLVVLPYISGTGSGVLQMAFGFRIPVVVTGVGCLSEITCDGKTGYVVPPADPVALAKAVSGYFKENKRPGFSAAMAEENAKHSWDNFAAHIIGVRESMGK